MDDGLAVLVSLPKLSHLLLDGSKVSDVGLSHLARLPSLTALYLESSDRPGRITDAGLAHLKALGKLDTLSINAANLTEAGFDALRETPLLTLGLSGLTAKQEGLIRILATRPLKNLSLSGPGVTDDWLRSLASPSSLISNLNLDGTQVTDDGMNDLGALPRLDYLTLDGTGLTNAGLVRLGASRSLRLVSARGTRVTDAGIAALHVVRPSINVELGPVVLPPRHRGGTNP